MCYGNFKCFKYFFINLFGLILTFNISLNAHIPFEETEKEAMKLMTKEQKQASDENCLRIKKMITHDFFDIQSKKGERNSKKIKCALRIIKELNEMGSVKTVSFNNRYHITYHARASIKARGTGIE